MPTATPADLRIVEERDRAYVAAYVAERCTKRAAEVLGLDHATYLGRLRRIRRRHGADSLVQLVYLMRLDLPSGLVVAGTMDAG